MSLLLLPTLHSLPPSVDDFTPPLPLLVSLQKGSGYHLDLLIVGIMIFVHSVLGLPWVVGATVRSITHVQSLFILSPCTAPGERPKFIGVRFDKTADVYTRINTARFWLAARADQFSCIFGTTSNFSPVLERYGLCNARQVIEESCIQTTRA